MNGDELANRLETTVHFYFDRIAGPLLLAYLFVAPLAVTAGTSITPEAFQTWRGAIAFIAPPILWNCLLVYGFILSDLLRHSSVGVYRAQQ